MREVFGLQVDENALDIIDGYSIIRIPLNTIMLKQFLNVHHECSWMLCIDEVAEHEADARLPRGI